MNVLSLQASGLVGSVCNGLEQIIFFGAFSIFESGGVTKHLRTFAPIVSAHPYCTRLHAQIHMPRHASSARAKY